MYLFLDYFPRLFHLPIGVEGNSTCDCPVRQVIITLDIETKVGGGHDEIVMLNDDRILKLARLWILDVTR